MNKLAAEFLENGYFNFPIEPGLKSEIYMLREAWTLFRRQLLTLKTRHVFSDELGGYEFKDVDSPDYKENFHITLEYEIPKNSTSTDGQLVTRGQNLIHNLEFLVYKIISTMDKAVGTNMAHIVSGSVHRWIIRLLYYPPIESLTDNEKVVIDTEDHILADPHIDKAITIHLDEDAPGLQVLWGNEWKNIYSSDKKVHGYYGMLGQYYSECKFPALCHRVVSNAETRTVGRTSIIIFCHFGDVRYNKKKYGRTHDVFPSGENYIMPYEVFVPYFEKI